MHRESLALHFLLFFLFIFVLIPFFPISFPTFPSSFATCPCCMKMSMFQILNNITAIYSAPALFSFPSQHFLFALALFFFFLFFSLAHTHISNARNYTSHSGKGVTGVHSFTDRLKDSWALVKIGEPGICPDYKPSPRRQRLSSLTLRLVWHKFRF